METERYIIAFFGVNTKYYTVDFVSYIWDKTAEKEYERSGIYVTALIDVRNLVCGKIRGCNLGDEAHIISTVRNPIESNSEDEFFVSLRNVINDVREELGMPDLTLSKDNIDYYYLIQP